MAGKNILDRACMWFDSLERREQNCRHPIPEVVGVQANSLEFTRDWLREAGRVASSSQQLADATNVTRLDSTLDI
jgi:hypothetical protein